MNKIVIGLLAHVDAGKTTLSEALLYKNGAIKNLGRVDHKDSLLDYDKNERNRGITIYNKDCRFKLDDQEIILLDTPGHIDFSIELERAIKAMDCAIFILNAQNPIQAHVKTIWKLLNHYHIPVIFFLNKMDIAYEDVDILIDKIRKELSYNIISFNENMYEDIATISDTLFNEYLSTNTISIDHIKDLIKNCLLYPLVYGSALKLEGLDDLLNIISNYLPHEEVSDNDDYYIYKVSKDINGQNLVHLKVNGGALYTKQVINEEKVDEIRIYNGLKYELVKEVKAKDICVIKGLNNLKADTYYPFKTTNNLLNPYLQYQIDINNINIKEAYDKLSQLNNEDPSLNIHLKDNKIFINLMGNIQKEILIDKVKDLFNLDISFLDKAIEYKETITKTVEGIGHFEPKAHYAEVHLLLKPLKRNSGIKISSDFKMDVPIPIKKMLIEILEDIEIKGILTNSSVCDIEIVLLGAKVSKAHTSKNDLYEATKRAIRMALIKADSQILEPYGNFSIISNPKDSQNILYELDKYNLKYNIEVLDLDNHITGSGPIDKLINIQNNLYPINFNFNYVGYEISDNQDEIMEMLEYDYLSDYDNPSGSIFFDKGAGFYVPFDEVEDYMHIDYLYQNKIQEKTNYTKYHIDDDEVKRVFERSNPVSKNKVMQRKVKTNTDYKSKVIIKPNLLIVDGYNMLYSWEIFKDEISHNLIDKAKDKLIDILNEYSVLKKIEVIVVFDAYKVKNNQSVNKKDHIEVVYTPFDQTADLYIESMIVDKLKKYDVRVASSDRLIQISIFNHGAKRISANELYKDYNRLLNDAYNKHQSENTKKHNQPFKDFFKDNS